MSVTGPQLVGPVFMPIRKTRPEQGAAHGTNLTNH
jgi:hypothetical protein